MPKINVYLPDDLAEQVKARDLPVSAICQRALREEVTRVEAIKQTGDIKVIVRPKGNPDYDPERVEVPDYEGQALLVHEEDARWVEGRWFLIKSDTGEMKFFPGPGPADQIEEALSEARRQLQIMDEPELERITVQVGEQSLTVGFEGRWLVYPDPDHSRTREESHDAATYYGVALTARGRIAVYSAHVNDWRPAELMDFDSLDDAEDHVPPDILARAAAELGEERVVWRDI